MARFTPQAISITLTIPDALATGDALADKTITVAVGTISLVPISFPVYRDPTDIGYSAVTSEEVP